MDWISRQNEQTVWQQVETLKGFVASFMSQCGRRFFDNPCTFGCVPGTWRIIPFSKWLMTMISKSPKCGYSPSKWSNGLINRGY